MSVDLTPPPRPSAVRLRALDGLRGIAAMIVVFHHTFLVSPALATPYRNAGDVPSGSLAWWLTYTPLHILWDGTEAVFIFFVLSGFVLVVPLTDGSGGRSLRGWFTYYKRRIVRLYLPAWGAIALCVGWSVLVPRHATARGSWWMNNFNSQGFTRDDVLGDASLLRSTVGATDSVLWSLRWEVVFSLMLPVAIVLARGLSRLWMVKLAALLALSAWGAHASQDALFYLPMFVAGSVLAFERHRLAGLQELAARRGRAGIVKVATLVVAVGLLSCYWPVYALHWSPRLTAYLAAAARGLEVLGACMVIVLLLQESAGKRLFERPSVQWLGRRSFSIYLVHLPIMVSIALVLGGRPPLWLLTPCVIVCSLIAAAWFYRLVEQPSLRAARSIGRSSPALRQTGVQQRRAHGAVSAAR